MNHTVNFDELAQKAFAPAASEADYEKLFAAAFSLSEWHFISGGKFPSIAPYCGVFPGYFENKPMVAGFTDAGRAEKRIWESNYSFGSADDPIILSDAAASAEFSEDKAILRLAPEKFLDYCDVLLKYGVEGIIFNSNKDSHGFFIGLAQLRPIRNHLESKNMLTENEAEKLVLPAQIQPKKESSNKLNFDALSLKAAQSNAKEDWNALFGAAFALPEWQFISRGELPNIRPFVASNAAIASNQPMIRVFTDAKRLIRFAKENNLTDADGSCKSITIPTADIVSYLEGFMLEGAYGVWFNSDTQSDGFFIPIKQLQPIKDHLAKINRQKIDAATQSAVTLQFVVQEGLMMPSGEVKPASYISNVFWRVPATWLENGRIKAENLRTFEKELSGRRSETIEGAFYVAVDYETKVFTPEEAKKTNWKALTGGNESNTFFIISGSGEGKMVSAEEFQNDIKASFQTTEKSDQSRPNVKTLIVQIKDGLGFPSGFVKTSEDMMHLFFRVPFDWLSDEQLKPEYLEKIYAKFYGANWRSGNSDGSHYKILDSYTKIFDAETLKTTKFAGTINQDKNQFFFYVGDQSGAIKKVTSEEFQADLDREMQSAGTNESRQRQDNLANWGMSETPDGDVDLNLTINKVGAVNFDTSMRLFYEAIAPWLKDYRGTGEFVSLLRFEPGGKSGEVENIAENAHGAYLQIRRFLYLNPKNNVRIGVNSIHSNNLRHIRSNAELLVSIELCKNIDNQTAVFYHAFQGPKSEILKLSAAIEPLLEAIGYQAVQ